MHARKMARTLRWYQRRVRAIFLACIYFTWRTRNVRFVLFNEAKYVSFSLYNYLLFSILIFVIQASNATGRKTLFLLRSILLLIGVTMSLCAIFVPKLIYFFTGTQLNKESDSPANSTVSSTISGTTHGTEFRTRTEPEVGSQDDLLKKIAFLQETVKRFEQKHGKLDQ
eukprot:TRINITY_DN2497_c0_g1_i3.p1 TRINITY_DN2497_c0_g1~~TRINITY_DN2497_c0_g1_i3.p1  ORF type:complete len:169 (-),score=56.46 TRINITY_DN2497_c0_g1_i3:150-656(-)